MNIEIDGLLIEPIKIRQSSKDLFSFLRVHKDISSELQSCAIHIYLRNNSSKDAEPQTIMLALNECELFSSFLGNDEIVSVGRWMYSSLLVDQVITNCHREDFGYVLDRGTLKKFQNFIHDLIKRIEEFNELGQRILGKDLLENSLFTMMNKVSCLSLIFCYRWLTQ
jgi:hypothetical protein